jgi:hypothetical protein
MQEPEPRQGQVCAGLDRVLRLAMSLLDIIATLSLAATVGCLRGNIAYCRGSTAFPMSIFARSSSQG